MAYDTDLAARLRDLLAGPLPIAEKEMFGGLAFMMDGHMFVGIIGDQLMVRVGPDQHAAALAQPHVRPMDFSGRPMRGYVYVAADGLIEDAALRSWCELALQFVGTLPPKAAAKRSAKSSA